MDQILRLNEFFVEGGKQDISHVLLHINEPSSPEEMKKGYFFALSETNSASVSYITKFQEIIDRAQTEYYEIPPDTARDPFELVLEKMNSESFVLEHEQGEMHSIVGAIRQNEIIFSYYGNPHLLLFYRNKNGAYEKMDLVKSNADDSESNGQMFSQVIQGKLTPNDFLFVGTPHIIDFFSHDRLEKIITTRSAEESAGHLEKVLSELKNGFSFGGLIIHLFKEEKAESTTKRLRPITESSSQSLKKLFNQEQTTAETLSPSLLPKLDRLRGILGSNENPTPSTGTPTAQAFKPAQIKSSHLTNRPRRAPSPKTGEKIAAFGNLLWKGIVIIAKFVVQILYVIYSIIYNIFSTIVLLGVIAINYKGRRNTILENWRMQWRSRKEGFKQLSFMTKFMMIGSVVMGLLLIGSILLIQRQQKITAEQAAFDNTLKDIQSKIDSAEGANTYKNDEVAYSDFKLAGELFAKLNCKTSAQKAKCAEKKTKLDELGITLRKIINANISLLTTFESLPKTGHEGLIRAKNKLIAFSPATSTLFIYDLLSGETKILPTYPSISGFTKAATPKENDYVLFVYNKKQLVNLSTSDLTFKLSEISYSSEKTEVGGFAVYNRRLYSLDIANGTILRHDSIKTGFGQGQEWLKDKSINLSDGSDLTIDGDVFVAKSNGEIAKYASGQSQGFALFGLDPVLSSATTIWTYTDVPYLYVLEPALKRLVIFEKDGHFIGQYTNQTFINPSGMSIDHNAKMAYLLDSGKLLKFPLK